MALTTAQQTQVTSYRTIAENALTAVYDLIDTPAPRDKVKSAAATLYTAGKALGDYLETIAAG